MSYSALRRTFRRFGYRPPVPPRKLRTEQPATWNHPWPPEYGRSFADFLSKQEAVLNANGEAETEKFSSQAVCQECDVDDELWVTG